MVALSTVEPELFSTTELSQLVRRIIVLNQKDGHDLTATMGGIGLRWVVNMDDDRRTLHCELRGPQWTLMAVMGQENAQMEFSRLIHVVGDRARFETDIIYLKIALS